MCFHECVYFWPTLSLTEKVAVMKYQTKKMYKYFSLIRSNTVCVLHNFFFLPMLIENICLKILWILVESIYFCKWSRRSKIFFLFFAVDIYASVFVSLCFRRRHRWYYRWCFEMKTFLWNFWLGWSFDDLLIVSKVLFGFLFARICLYGAPFTFRFFLWFEIYVCMLEIWWKKGGR